MKLDALVRDWDHIAVPSHSRYVRHSAVAAEWLAIQTRLPSLVLAMSSENNMTLSFTCSGAPIPAGRSPNRLFR
jgi:hypothetical protein